MCVIKEYGLGCGWLLSAALGLSFAVPTFAAADSGASARVVRVSPNGSVSSLKAARDAVRAIRQGEGGKRLPIDVVFEDGIYSFAEPVAFDAADAGTPDAPVAYRAAHRGKAIFSGARTLAWRKPAPDDAGLARIPEAARGHVLMAEVPAGIALNGFSGGREQQNDYPLMLYVGERMLPNAAWPNAPKRWEELGSEFVAANGDATAALYNANKKAKENIRFVSAARDRLARWKAEPDLWAYGFWSFMWDDSCAPVRDVDCANGEITMGKKGIEFMPTKPAVYRMLNAFCELDEPGEWVIDRARRRVYAWLPEGDAVCSAAEGFVRAKALSNVTFDGFVLEHSRGDAMRFDGCREVRVQSSLIRAIGGYGAVFTCCRRCRVEGCDLRHLGEGGIILAGGVRKTMEAGENIAINNIVAHYGERVPCYRAGISCGLLCGGGRSGDYTSVGNRVEHNLVHHSRHMGIGFQGLCDYFGYNVVHDVCAHTVDAGPIYGYVADSWALQRGTTIEYNVFYKAGGANPALIFAIYIDGIVSGITVRGNYVVRASTGLYQNGGQDNVYERNVVCATRYGAERRDLGYTNPVTRPDSEPWRNLQANKALYHSPLWAKRFPNLARLSDMTNDAAFAQCAHFCVHSNNVYAASGAPVYYTEKTGGTCIVRDNVQLPGDPGFTDYSHFDWTLKPGSPAQLAVGDLPFKQMGLFASPLRFSPAVQFAEDVTPAVPLEPIR